MTDLDGWASLMALGIMAFDVAVGFSIGWYFRGRKHRRESANA